MPAAETLKLPKTNAIYMVLGGVALALLYKGWKSYLRQSFGLDPQADYVIYEALATVFRGLSAVAGAVLLFKFVPRPAVFFYSQNRKSCYILVVYLFTFATIKVALYGVPALGMPFVGEAVINSLTGLSEEIVFRGLIFAGLWRLCGCWWGVVLSSAFFSLWHYDVQKDYLEFLFLFAAGLVYACSFRNGAGLLFMALIHFLWDQFVFGLNWQGSPLASYFLPALIVHSMLFALGLGLISRQRNLQPHPC